MSIIQCVLVFTLVLVSNVQSAKILGIFTVPSVSHQIVFQPIWKELSLRGHEVTIMSPNPLKDPTLTNLTEIDLSFMYRQMEELKEVVSQGLDHWSLLMSFIDMFTDVIMQSFESKEVQDIIKDNTTKYDLILVEAVDTTNYAFATKFDCPVIAIASLSVMTATHEAMGNPVHPVLHPDFLTPYYGGEMSFFEKVDAVLFDWYQRIYFNEYRYYPVLNSISRKYFGNQIPDLHTLERNISMLFLNTNPILHGVRPYGPNVIEFGGGIHIKPPKPLPSELKLFLDNAPEGIIYFSLGSNVKSLYLPQEKRNILIQTFAKLPYKVLWKFEDDKMELKPKNVEISKWLPQQDILRHPNIKLFITQAGLQSTEEALFNGVPLLALPFMADQHANAKSIVKLGVGLDLDFSTLSEENFHSSILEIITNPRYKKKATEIGQLLKDQPMTGLEKVVWWAEYVIRNKGAPYLKNPRANVSWAEFLILDVVSFLFAILFVIAFVIYKISELVYNLAIFTKKLKRKSE